MKPSLGTAPIWFALCLAATTACSSGGSGACTASASYGTVDAGSTQAAEYYQPDDAGNPAEYDYQAQLNSDALYDSIDMSMFGGTGVFASGLDAGTFTIAGSELNYSTCGLCLLILTDTDADGAPTDSYLATGGTVTITAFEPTLTGTISNATFQHVTIDPSTNISTAVGDGCDASITSLPFSATVAVNPPARSRP